MKNETLTLILIKKNFETFSGIFADLYSVRTTEKLNKENLRCENLKKLNEDINIIKKEYKFTDLNDELKSNLININDYLKYVNNNENVYIVLCGIRFDETILKNINLNKLINLNVEDMENKFIKKYSMKYNLIKF